jgi:uncharacterized protein
MQRFLPGRHLPGHHEIESFGNGGFRLGGVSHAGSILITASGARALDVASVAELTPAHLDVLLAEKDQSDMLLIGAGREMLPLPKPVMNFLRENGIGYDLMTTNAAVRTYNVVLAEDRRVSAIIIAVDKAYG